MGRSKWLLLLLIPMLFGFDTRNPFRTRGPFRTDNSPIGSAGWDLQFGACTKGVNCFCDQQAAQYGSSILFCEDYDHPALYELNPNGPNPNGTSNWVAGGTDRGSLSYPNGIIAPLTERWLDPSPGGLWANGTPSSPTVGSTCVSGTGRCTGLKVWAPGDRWNANNYAPWLAFVAPGDFDAENATSLTPFIPGSNGAEVFGNYSKAYRIPAFTEDTANAQTGFTGGRLWSLTNHFSVAQAITFESNIDASGIYSGSWKHDEWVGSGDCTGCANQALSGFSSNGNFPGYSKPFHFFIFNVTPCSSRVAGATVNAGHIACTGEGGFLYWYPDQADWDYNSFDFESWHCLSAYYDMRTPSASIMKVWKDGATDPIIDIVVDLSGTVISGGTKGVGFNSYANTNYAPTTGVPRTTVSTRRYQDNFLVRQGSAGPIACSELGFQ